MHPGGLVMVGKQKVVAVDEEVVFALKLPNKLRVGHLILHRTFVSWG